MAYCDNRSTPVAPGSLPAQCLFSNLTPSDGFRDFGVCALVDAAWAHWPGAEVGDSGDVTLMIDGVPTRRVRLPAPAQGWGSTWVFSHASGPWHELTGDDDDGGWGFSQPHRMAVSERSCSSRQSPHRELLADYVDTAGAWYGRMTIVTVEDRDDEHTDVTAVALAAAAGTSGEDLFTDSRLLGTDAPPKIAFVDRPSGDRLRLAMRKRRWQPTPGGGSSCSGR